jgi:hypothetical protein
VDAAHLEIVIARFQEDLSWIRNLPEGVRVTVYDKSGTPLPAAHPLPNVGREAHTYFHHLVTRYGSLGDLTLFCQGKPFDHAPDLHKIIRHLLADEECVKEFRWLGFLIDTDDAHGRLLFQKWSKNPERRRLHLDALYRALFEKEAPETFTFHGGGQFFATRACLHRRPKAFYEKALKVSSELPDAAHGFERMWDQVFGVRGIDPELLKNGTPVYLKPIRRLDKSP